MQEVKPLVDERVSKQYYTSK